MSATRDFALATQPEMGYDKPDLEALVEMTERQQRFCAGKTFSELDAWVHDAKDRWTAAELRETLLIRCREPEAECLAATQEREAVEREVEDAGFELAWVLSIGLVELRDDDDGDEEVPF